MQIPGSHDPSTPARDLDHDPARAPDCPRSGSMVVVAVVGGLLLSSVLAGGCGRKGSRSPDARIPPTAIPPVGYRADLVVPASVQNECELETKIPEWIAQNVAGATPGPALDGRVLTIEITEMMGSGGGAWTGPKRLSVEGTLTDGDAVLGTFKAQRTTGGGMWGAYKGTCSMLETCGEELGEDIGAWLAAPTMDGMLGEFE